MTLGALFSKGTLLLFLCIPFASAGHTYECLLKSLNEEDLIQ